MGFATPAAIQSRPAECARCLTGCCASRVRRPSAADRLRAADEGAQRNLTTCEDPLVDLTGVYRWLVAEVGDLLPADAVVVDAHTHLGRDEDGQELDLAALIASLDEIGPNARACTFALHDPDRAPAYRLPNERVLR
jgi:hypothetical protein